MPSSFHTRPSLEPKLIPRVREYLLNCDDNFVDVSKIAAHLQNKYKEYGRKKKNAFLSSVRHAYTIISEQELKTTSRNPFSNSTSSNANDPSAEILVDSCSSPELEAASSSNYVHYEDTNAINNVLTNLYDNNKKPPLVQQTYAKTIKTGSSTIGENSTIERKINTLSNLDASYISSAKGNNDSYLKKRKLSSPSTNNNVVSQNQTANVSKSNHKNSTNQTKDVLLLEHSTLKFSDIGGCESQLLEICKMVMHLKHPELYSRMGFKPPRGFLLHGPPGCGKTMVAYALAGELNLPFIKIASPEIVSGVSGDSEQKIRDLFAQASAFAPCILFMDEIDSIAPRRDTAQREMERRIVAQLLSCLDDLDKSDKQVLVIGATNRPDSIDPALRRAGRFDKEIGLGMPDEKSREKILNIVCRDLNLEPQFDMKMLSRLTPGYVGADLSALAREACVIAMNRVFRTLFNAGNESIILDVELELERARSWLQEKPPINYDEIVDLYVTMLDFKLALKNVTPSAKREGFVTVPDVTWDDVGALASVRENLKWSILYPIKRPEIFESLGLNTRPQGVLLCGPPGCGKTLIAKAVANESGMNFISVKGPELLSMYVGESERAVRQVFQRALNSSPCVIFFDELDSLCPRRSEHESGGTARVVNQLLTEMDGVEGRKSVFIIGATNRPDIIDPAIMRPGRLDKVLYVGFPTPDDKVDILSAITKNRSKPPIDDNLDFYDLMKDKRAEFYTGADLAALVHEAAVSAVREHTNKCDSQLATVMDSDIPPSFMNIPITVGRKHFEAAFDKVKASVSYQERKIFLKLKRKYDDTGAENENSNLEEEEADEDYNFGKFL